MVTLAICMLISLTKICFFFAPVRLRGSILMWPIPRVCVFYCVAVCMALFFNKTYFMESARASPVKLGTFSSNTFSVQISSLILRTIETPIASIHSKHQSRHTKVSKTLISTLVHYLQLYFSRKEPADHMAQWSFQRNVWLSMFIFSSFLFALSLRVSSPRATKC